MQVPRPVMDKDLQAEEKQLTDDINNMTKKVSSVCFNGYYAPIQPFTSRST